MLFSRSFFLSSSTRTLLCELPVVFPLFWLSYDPQDAAMSRPKRGWGEGVRFCIIWRSVGGGVERQKHKPPAAPFINSPPAPNLHFLIHTSCLFLLPDLFVRLRAGCGIELAFVFSIYLSLFSSSPCYFGFELPRVNHVFPYVFSSLTMLFGL